VRKKPGSLVIVAPIYNEEEGLERFLDSLTQAIRPIEKLIDVHFCGVNNGSTDDTLLILTKYKTKVRNFSYITLTRNFGYEAALEAGMRTLTADYYSLIDADGEDPVELLPVFYHEITNGFEIVYGIREMRQEAKTIQGMRRIFYKVLHKLADDPFWQNVGEFSMFSRTARNAILQETNSFPFWRASLARVGFSSKGIPHSRNLRIAGKSKLNARRMMSFGLAGLLSTTTSPLRINAYLFMSFVAFCFGLLTLQTFLDYESYVFEWLVYFFFLISSFSISTLSIYTARLYKNSLNRPNYFIDWSNSSVDSKIRANLRESS